MTETRNPRIVNCEWCNVEIDTDVDPEPHIKITRVKDRERVAEWFTICDACRKERREKQTVHTPWSEVGKSLGWVLLVCAVVLAIIMALGSL